MNNIIIGIDFSIKNSSACICTNFETYKFISVCSDYKFTKNKIKLLEDLNYLSDTSIKISEENKEEFTTYFAEQRFRLDRYSKNITEFINIIKLNIPSNSNIIVAIEGISYMSQGNILVDISLATGILRYKVLTELLNNDSSKFFVFSPSELKVAAGCKGNADKFILFNQFKNNPIIESVKNTEFYKFILNNENRINNGKAIESPINDLIDGFSAISMIYKNFKNN